MLLQQLDKFLDSSAGLAVLTGALFLINLPFYLYLRSKQSPYRGQILVLVSLTYLSLVFLLLSLAFPVKGKVSAGVTPRLWIGGIFLCVLYLAFRIVQGKEKPDTTSGGQGLRMVGFFIFLCVAFLVLINILGFFIASALFLLVGMRRLSYASLLGLTLILAVWDAFLYIVFYSLLSVPLPEGVLLSYIFG